MEPNLCQITGFIYRLTCLLKQGNTTQYNTIAVPWLCLGSNLQIDILPNLAIASPDFFFFSFPLVETCILGGGNGIRSHSISTAPALRLSPLIYGSVGYGQAGYGTGT